MIYNVYRFRDSIRKKMTDGKLKKSQTQTGKKKDREDRKLGEKIEPVGEKVGRASLEGERGEWG